MITWLSGCSTYASAFSSLLHCIFRFPSCFDKYCKSADKDRNQCIVLLSEKIEKSTKRMSCPRVYNWRHSLYYLLLETKVSSNLVNQLFQSSQMPTISFRCIHNDRCEPIQLLAEVSSNVHLVEAEIKLSLHYRLAVFQTFKGFYFIDIRIFCCLKEFLNFRWKGNCLCIQKLIFSNFLFEIIFYD